jgi:SAM-dependent methyltransferase/predicted O-methyltransferase YrrM
LVGTVAQVCTDACIAFGREHLGREDVAGKEVLEVGALEVNASLRPDVEALGPKKYLGVDLWLGPGVDEICAAERLAERFGPDSFDVVIATEVLEHIDDWRAAVHSMKTVLRPGGVALLTTRSPGFPYHGYPADYWRFDPELMGRVFADFEVDALAPDPTRPGVFLKAKKRAQWTPVDLSALEPAAVERPPLRQRAFRVLWRTATRTFGLLPVSARSPRQLARESLAAGAIQKVSELARLIALVKACRPRAVLEIGSYRGGTLAAWCKVAARDAVVVSVDLPAEYGTPATPEELKTLARPGQRLEVVRGDSHADETRAQVETALGGREVDLLMIDGDHRYDGVRRDFELYAPLVRDGGLIAFHDILPHPKVPGVEVDRLWSELRDRYEHEEFVATSDEAVFGRWGGIGVLRYRRELLSR